MNSGPSLLHAYVLLVSFVMTLLTGVSAVAAPAANRVTLVEAGRARAIILLAADAAQDEVLAGSEIQAYVRQISGTEIPIRRVAPEALSEAAGEAGKQNQTPLLLGGGALAAQLKARIMANGTDPGSFALQMDPARIVIAGLSPEGTLFGAYELLEQLGVRWFMPGDLGTVIPKSTTVSISAQETIQVPSFAGRWHRASVFPEWARRVRMGGPYLPPAHGVPGIRRADFANHPDYFALIGGKRVAKQLHVSNPEVVRIVTEATRAYFRKNPDVPWIGLGPGDGGGFCECDQCRALDGGDWDPFSNERSVTDRYIWFFNQILDGIKDEFPGKKIAFYSYHTYMRPPVKTVPNPLIVPAFAPLSICRIHGMDNPVCPERSYYKSLMESWGKILPDVYERGYWFNLADPGFPFSEVHRMRTDIPLAHQLGIKGWRVETVNHWGSETPSLYIAAKLMWNHNADVDALLADFYEKFFGPARKPMAEYFTLMDAALRDADYHTGSSFDMPHLYPAAVREKARKALKLAAGSIGRNARDEIYGARVKIFQSTFDYLETFISMLENQNRSQFAAALADLNQLDALQKTLVAYDPPMIDTKLSASYLQRFFRQPVEQGAARAAQGKGQIVPLQDEWQFQIDPQKIGDATGLWRADAVGGNWQRLKTSSQSWSNQGLRTYKGEAWYRQEVAIPASFSGQRVFLWFGGVDEKAKVWVNGSLAGISHGASFLPFEFDVTSAVKAGQRNVVAVRVINERVDELGTGGLTAPAMFYLPAADAQPDNRKQAAPTFP